MASSYKPRVESKYGNVNKSQGPADLKFKSKLPNSQSNAVSNSVSDALGDRQQSAKIRGARRNTKDQTSPYKSHANKATDEPREGVKRMVNHFGKKVPFQHHAERKYGIEQD